MVRRRPPSRRRRGRSRPASRAKGGGRAGRWVLLIVAAIALFAAGLYLGRSDFDPATLLPRLADGLDREPATGQEETTAPPERPTEPPPAPAPPRHEEHEFAVEETPEPPVITEPPPPGHGVVVAVVIDDLGRSLADLDRIRDLGVPVTYAVLPYESRTPQVVAELERRGEEMILHLPMEPSNGANPGPGALTREMSRRELVEGTRRALEAVPGAVGVNHHMGSLLSVDRRSMDTILGVISGRGLYYLDSRTSAESVAYAAARALDVPAAERQVFLDPDPRPAAVRYQFRRLLEQARERGAAIAIGHPHPDTLTVLAEEVPLAADRGYQFVPVSFLVDRSGLAAK